MKLIEHLNNFKGASSEDEVTKELEKLAPAFLYGGYINVRNRYHIYIRAVEFYYHEENGNLKDPIVYHRNKHRDVDGKVPYYPALMLHAHNSGYDITFENEEKGIRSSALIRAYEVYDVDEKCLWCWEVNDGKGHFVQRDPQTTTGRKRYNTQCTYLKAVLNGFNMGDKSGIEWVDFESYKGSAISHSTRQGVYQSESTDIYMPKKEKCNRQWAYRREKDIELE